MSSLYKHKTKLVWALTIKDPRERLEGSTFRKALLKDAQSFKNKRDALVAAVRLNESLEDSLITWLEKQSEQN